MLREWRIAVGVPCPSRDKKKVLSVGQSILETWRIDGISETA
jgi:hypothetical protein